MHQEFTAEQKSQLKTWAEQRDAFISEISVLRNKKEALALSNNDLANANTDIQDRMKVIEGRIIELKIKEAEIPASISKEIAILQVEKSTVEAKIPILKDLINALTLQKTSLEADVVSAVATFRAIKDEVLLLDKVVDRVTVVSKGNTEKINLLFTNLGVSS